MVLYVDDDRNRVPMVLLYVDDDFFWALDRPASLWRFRRDLRSGGNKGQREKARNADRDFCKGVFDATRKMGVFDETRKGLAP